MGIASKRQSYLAQGDFVYRHQPVPVFVKAEGPFLVDNKGLKYFDAEAANGTASLGFDKTILSQAVKNSEKLPSVPSFCESEIRLKVAKRIVKKMKKITGYSGRVAFELGGAQGVELALKIIKSNQKKSQFVVFEGGYHGRSIYTSQLSASHRYRSIMGEWRIPVTRLPYPDFTQTTSLKEQVFQKKQAITYIKRLTKTETGGLVTRYGKQDIAALIIEPLLNAGGIVKPDQDYLETIVEIFRKLGALIVLDEIFCGFYRTGPMFGFQHYKFTPDIVVMSKAITNGITPLSCVWARDPYLLSKSFPSGTHSATFINNSLALNVVDIVLSRYQKWKTKKKDLNSLQNSLQEMIDKILKFSKLTVNGYALGGVGRILLKKNNAGKILEIARTVAKREPINGVHGLILASTGMVPNVIALNPPLNIDTRQVKILKKLLVLTFEKAQRVLKNDSNK